MEVRRHCLAGDRASGERHLQFSSEELSFILQVITKLDAEGLVMVLSLHKLSIL